jgi:hypothetical protein
VCLLALAVLSQAGTWVDLKNGIRFMRQVENVDDKGKAQKTTYFMESKAKDGNTVINDFVDQALEVRAGRPGESRRLAAA